jgi:hypothetical protein
MPSTRRTDFDPGVSGKVWSVDENILSNQAKDISASFVSPCECPEISRRNGLYG